MLQEIKGELLKFWNWIKSVTAGFIAKAVITVQEIAIDVAKEFQSQKLKMALLYFFLSWHMVNRTMALLHNEYAIAAVFLGVLASWAFVMKWFIVHASSGEPQ